jgi:CubicO group peptidase (beta-lactamase class C family)
MPILSEHKLFVSLWAVSLNGSFLPMDSHASGSIASEAKPSLTGGQELTAEDLSKFTAKLMADHLVRYGMSGALVVVVKDARVLFSKGFGFADLARHRPTTADATLVNIASLTGQTSVMRVQRCSAS